MTTSEAACIPLLSPPLQQVVYPCEESKLNVAATFESSRWLEKKNITGEKMPNLGLASLRKFSHMGEELEQGSLEKVGVLQSVCTRGAEE